MTGDFPECTVGLLRDRLMPINRKHPIPELLHAVREYQAETGQRVTFEYAS